MEIETFRLITALFAAHCIGDFYLQTSDDAKNKARIVVLIKHSAIHAVLAWILAGYPSNFAIPLFIFVSHSVIDFVKARVTDSLRGFIIDQLAHMAVIAIIPFVIEGVGMPLNAKEWVYASTEWLSHVILVHIAGVLFTVNGGSYLLAKFVMPYQLQLKQQLKNESGDDDNPLNSPRGLRNAGRTIGKLERFLVYLLIHIGQPAGIGFLVAAKSIFRFGELREASNRMESEYIIIGTLGSFAYAITVTYFIQWWLSLTPL